MIFLMAVSLTNDFPTFSGELDDFAFYLSAWWWHLLTQSSGRENAFFVSCWIIHRFLSVFWCFWYGKLASEGKEIFMVTSEKDWFVRFSYRFLKFIGRKCKINSVIYIQSRPLNLNLLSVWARKRYLFMKDKAIRNRFRYGNIYFARCLHSNAPSLYQIIKFISYSLPLCLCSTLTYHLKSREFDGDGLFDWIIWCIYATAFAWNIKYARIMETGWMDFLKSIWFLITTKGGSSQNGHSDWLW